MTEREKITITGAKGVIGRVLLASLTEFDLNPLQPVLLNLKIPNNYLIIYGVSNNDGKIHDTSNPLNWSPRHGAR